MYDDEYTLCGATHATLRILGLDPEEVTRTLALSPTRALPQDARARQAVWLLESKPAVESKDLRRHLDWILDQLAARRDAVWELVARGGRVDIFCYWASARGHGGPTISPAQSKKLAELEIAVLFDVYFVPENT